jgi:hypothetical protein
LLASKQGGGVNGVLLEVVSDQYASCTAFAQRNDDIHQCVLSLRMASAVVSHFSLALCLVCLAPFVSFVSFLSFIFY